MPLPSGSGAPPNQVKSASCSETHSRNAWCHNEICHSLHIQGAAERGAVLRRAPDSASRAEGSSGVSTSAWFGVGDERVTSKALLLGAWRSGLRSPRHRKPGVDQSRPWPRDFESHPHPDTTARERLWSAKEHGSPGHLTTSNPHKTVSVERQGEARRPRCKT